MNGAEIIIKVIEDAGIKNVFGYPGESTLPLIQAINKSSNINHIVAGCERGAGYIADSFVRYGDRIAICYAPGGIGSPVSLPAIVECYNSSIPVIFISTTEPLKNKGKWSTSTFNHELFSYTCKENIRIDSIGRLKSEFERAIRVATAPRTGPCHIDIPCDILEMDYEEEYITNLNSNCSIYPSYRPHGSKEEINKVLEYILEAKKPVILLGGGAQLSNIKSNIIEELAEKLDIRIATTLNGKGIINEYSKFSIGVIGQKGNSIANEIFSDSDLMIIVGSKTGDKSTMNWKIFDNNCKVIQVDVDPCEIGRNTKIELGIFSDTKAFFEDLLEIANIRNIDKIERRYKNNLQEKHENGIISSIYIELSKIIDENSCFIADASQSCGWMGAYLKSRLKARGTSSPRGTGSIGYALPACIGAAFANPKNTIFGMGGDAGFQMSLSDMETCKRFNLDVKFFLINNNRLGLLENHMRNINNETKSIVEKTRIDWEKIADAFKWEYILIEDKNDIKRQIEKAIKTTGPVLIDVIDDNIKSPDFLNTVKMKGK